MNLPLAALVFVPPLIGGFALALCIATLTRLPPVVIAIAATIATPFVTLALMYLTVGSDALLLLLYVPIWMAIASFGSVMGLKAKLAFRELWPNG